jgi:hypothetical protein
MADTYETWLTQVQEALHSINMDLADWQSIWPFDFQGEHKSGTTATGAAMRANRFWWHRQNKSFGKGCRQTSDCWLPQDHQGPCEPV